MNKNEREGNRKNKVKGYSAFTAFGCCVLIITVLIVVVFVAVRSSAGSDKGLLGLLAGLFRAATVDRNDMDTLKGDLAAKYPSEDIGIRARARTLLGSGQTRLTLDLEFLNPQFAIWLQEPETAQVAREISLFIALMDPNIERFEIISITFLFTNSEGVGVGTSATYRFEVADLLKSTEAAQ